MNRTLNLFTIVSGLLLAACGGEDEDPCSVPGTACRWAGTGERGFNNLNQDAPPRESKLYAPEDLTFAPDGRAYLVDWNNHRIRRLEANNRLVTVIGTDYEGDGSEGETDRLPTGNPAGAPGTAVAMNHPSDVKFGPDGRLYIAAWHNNKIRVFDPATDIVTVVGGDGYGFAGDGGPCNSALFNQPKSIAFAGDGTLYTIDQRNVRIRRVDTGGIITTMSGNGTVGNTGDGALAADATWGLDIGTTPRPSGALLLTNNTLYVADSRNNRIRKIDLATGLVSAVAGDLAGTAGSADGVGAEARFDYPMDLELGPEGLIYVADRYNNSIRAIDTTTGAVTTVAGNGQKCDGAACLQPVDGLAALDLQLNQPYGIAFDPTGSLYIADTNNHQIVKVTR